MSWHIAGLVLAGGQSRRMGGGDKFLIELNGRTLLEHAIERLRPQVGELAISANCDPGLLAAYRLPVLPDPAPAGRGPLAGILAGLDWAAESSGASHLVTAASDTPFFPADLVARLAQAAGSGTDTIVLAASAGRVHPVFGLWPLVVREPLRRWMKDGPSLKVTDFTDTRSHARCDFEIGATSDPFFNINTPDDLELAANRATEHTA
jgi:molybdopterin-guanine dinucleotide biosynthesis protein A